MVAFLETIAQGILLFANHILETIRFIPNILLMFFDSYSLIYTSIGSAPAFLVPILLLILSVAVIMWLVNLL